MFEKYPDIVTVDNLMDIGKAAAYSLLQSNQIRHVRIGKKYIIPKQAILEFLNPMCYHDIQMIDCGQTKTVLKGEILK